MSLNLYSAHEATRKQAKVQSCLTIASKDATCREKTNNSIFLCIWFLGSLLLSKVCVLLQSKECNEYNRPLTEVIVGKNGFKYK